jgi:mono/diheme cytochrome c family protein
MKKNLLCLLLIAVLAAALAACGGEAAEPTAAPTDPPPAPTEAPTEVPTEAPAEEPTAEPTEEPTAEPTEEPTAAPTEEPTAEPEATIDAPAGWPASVSDLPEGDAANGQALYFGAPGCSGCHGDPAVPGSSPFGPHHGNIGVVAGQRVAGQSAAVYLYESILNPSAFIAPDCANDTPCADPSAMPANFAEQLSQQDVADLIAYMLSLIE